MSKRSIKDMEADLTARGMYVSYNRASCEDGECWMAIVTKDGQEVFRCASATKREAIRKAWDWCTLPFVEGS